MIRPACARACRALPLLGLLCASAGAENRSLTVAARLIPATLQATPTVEAITGLEAFTVQQIDLPATAGNSLNIRVMLDGTPHRLILQPHSLRSAGFQVLVQGHDGQLRSWAKPVARTFRGTVEGLAESRVAASISAGPADGGMKLSVRIEFGASEVWHIEPLSRFVDAAAAAAHVVYRAEDLTPENRGCGAKYSGAGAAKARFKTFGEAAMDNTAAVGLQVCDIAFDADVEFYAANGRSVANTVRDIENVMNQVALIYENEANITFEITTIVVRTAEPDPYISFDNEELLAQMRYEWNINMKGGHRDIAHLMTGKDVALNVIGSAYLNTVCDVCGLADGYGFSQSRYTSLMSRRACLTAHEIGHNFGAHHCDRDADCFIMCPVIGSCAGNCTGFGSRSTIAIANEAAGATCLATLAPPVDLPFCDTFDAALESSKWSYNAIASLSGGSINPPSPPNALLLDTCCTGCAAAPDEIRTNFIRLGGAETATLSYYTQHAGGPSTAGSELIVDYWSQIGGWVELNRIASDGTSQTEFAFWSHALPRDALHDEFRLRLRLDGVTNQADWFIDDLSIIDIQPEWPVLYVRRDAPEGGSGSSWATAYTDLQEALGAATCARDIVEEIWVAAGTYTPDQGTDDPEAAFVLLNGISIYGGFRGTETRADQRDPQANVTVLSGEIGILTSTFDNSYHVVTANGTDGTAVLDGFTITGGQANGAAPDDTGGGLLVISGSPTVLNCTFIGNSATNGGAVHNSTGSRPMLERCTFVDNSATSSGGAMYNSLASMPTLLDCIFLGNVASFAGGAVFNSSSSVTMVNCAFSGNVAASGGAIQNFGSSSTLTNCTLSRNVATSIGGGIVNNGSSATLRSCILWGNRDSGGTDESAQVDGLPPSIDYSCVQGWSGAFGGVDNIGADPTFIDAGGADGVAGTVDDNLRLRPNSPAINVGDPTPAPAAVLTDLDGHARVLCARVDMGAYETGLGDVDCDGAITLDDFAGFAACVTGPDGGPLGSGCAAFDVDADSDVDLSDFAGYQSLFMNGSP